MANKSAYTFMHITAPDPTPASLKKFGRQVNDAIAAVTTKVWGNVEYSDLHSTTQKVIEEKVDAKTLVEELATKADIGDLAYIGDTFPTSTPAANKVMLYTGVVPNEWLKWKGVTAASTARSYSASASGTSPSFPDLSDKRDLGITVKTVAAQAGIGTPSPTNIRAITGKASVTVTVNGVEKALTPSATLYGLAGYEDEIGNDGHETHKTGLVSLTGSENWGYVINSDTNYCSLYVQKSVLPGMPNDSTATPFSCSHFVYGNGGQDNYHNRTGNLIYGYADSSAAFIITAQRSVVGSDLAAAKAWMVAQANAGTPVQITYCLATPTTSTGTATAITGVDGTNTVTSDGSSVTVTYTGSGWTNVGGTAEMAALVSQIGAMTLNNGDFRGLLQSISKTANGLLLTGLGGTLSLLLGPNRIGFWDSGEEVAYITNNKLYINSGEFVAELKIGNYYLVPDSSGGLVIK